MNDGETLMGHQTSGPGVFLIGGGGGLSSYTLPHVYLYVLFSEVTKTECRGSLHISMLLFVKNCDYLKQIFFFSDISVSALCIEF